jgi:hypothetical protein
LSSAIARSFDPRTLRWSAAFRLAGKDLRERGYRGGGIVLAPNCLADGEEVGEQQNATTEDED